MDIKPLILIDTSIIGGPGRGLFQLLKGLAARGMPYLLCNFRYSKPKSMEFVNEVARHGITFDQIPQKHLLDPRPIWHFYRLARRGNFNLLQSHGYKSHLVALVVSKLTALPWVAFAHGWTAEDSKVKKYHALDKWMLRYASVVVAVSPGLAQTFKKIRGNLRRTELVLNAIDADAIPGLYGGQAIRNEYSLKDNDILIGVFGRLSFEKGQDLLLQAFAELSAGMPNLKLLLLGDGPEREKLVAWVHERGLQNRIFFKSHSANIKDYYQAINLLVLPSRSEGLPNVILEAMAFSVPVLSTNVGAISEIITSDQNGWIVPVNDPVALTEGIRKVVSDPVTLKEIGARGKISLSPKFCPNARVEKIVAIYKQALVD